MIIVDGNDGTGKSTLVAALRARGIEAGDRGIPTKMTDDPTLMPGGDHQNRYVIIDLPVEVSRERLAKAGKDLNEKYHTVADLTHYRVQFLHVAYRLLHAFGPTRVLLLNGLEPTEKLVEKVTEFALMR